MGKKGILAQQDNDVPEYEKLRLKRLASNAARLEAAGLQNLASKSLREKCDRVASYAVRATNLSIEDMEGQREALAKRKCLKEKEATKSLDQSVTMAEFLKLKSRKRSNQEPPTLDSGQKQLQPKKQHKVVQHQVKQPQVQGRLNQKSLPQGKSNQNKYCAPGSISAYFKMRKTQEEKRQPDSDLNLDDFESDDLNDINELPLEHENMSQQQSSDLGNDMIPDQEEHTTNCQLEVAEEHEIVVENQSPVGGKASQTKKHRGRTVLANLHARTREERDVIVLNYKHQPVGSSDDVVRKFSSFLGTLAKNPTLAPLNYISWKYMPTKDKLWEYVKQKFIVPEEGKKYVLQTINDAWRLYKARLKMKYYYPYETLDERLANRPVDIPLSQFKELLEFWDSEVAKEMSSKNKQNQEMHHDYHTMGRCSFAMLAHKMQKNSSDKKLPSKGELYIESRKRVPGRRYKTNNEVSLQNIEKITAIQSLPNRNGKVDPYYEVITKKEHSGRLRLQGRGVTMSNLKEKDGKTPFILPSMYIETIKEHMEQTIISKILAQLQSANPGINLVIPDISPISRSECNGEDGGSNGIANSDEHHSDEDHE